MRKAILACVLVLLLGLIPSITLADILDITSVVKTVEPNTIVVGERATVKLTIQGTACQVPAGKDIALIMDTSGSMDGVPLQSSVVAAKNFVDRLNDTTDRGAVVEFNDGASVVAGLGSSKDQLKAALDGLFASGGTDIASGVSIATGVLNDPARGRAMLLLTDGQSNEIEALQAAQNACGQGMQIFTIGLGDVNPDLLTNMACNGGAFYPAPTPQDLDAIYQQIANVLVTVGTSATFTDTIDLYPNILVAPGTISDGGVPSNSSITWQIADVRNNKVLSYQIDAVTEGTYTIPGGTVTYNDCDENPQTLPYNGTTFTVVGEEPPEPPTDIPEPGTIALLGGGIAALGAYMRRRRAQKQGEQL